jgi:hypothetical protein
MVLRCDGGESEQTKSLAVAVSREHSMSMD